VVLIKKDKDKLSAEVNQDILYGSFEKQKDKNEVVQVIKELFDPAKIDQITELTEDEIKIITAISMVAELKDMAVWKHGIDKYMMLMLSKKRKSRSEVIEAIKGYTERVSGLNRLIPQQWRR